MKKNKNLKVAVVMGSQSDYKTMKLATNILKKLGIKFETKIISAHRTPNRMYDYAKRAEKNNNVPTRGGTGRHYSPMCCQLLSSTICTRDHYTN